MSSVPSEPPELIFADKTELQGTILRAVAFGAQFMLYCVCLHMLWSRKNRDQQPRRNYWLIAFTTIITIFSTLNIASAASFTQYAFVDNRTYPAGPAAFEVAVATIPINLLGSVTFMLSTWACDALMLWRFWIIFKTSMRMPTFFVMLFPCLVFAATWSISVLLLIQLTVTTAWGSASQISWTLPWFSLSLSFNVIMTLAIVGRLLYYRRSILSIFPGSSYGKHYTSISAMVVESSLLTSTFSIMCIVPLARGSAVAYLFYQPLGQVQVIATLLIVYRVSLGRAWAEDTSASLAIKAYDPDNSPEISTANGRSQTIIFAPAVSEPAGATTDSKLFA